MPDETPLAADDLQFDRAVTGTGTPDDSGASGRPAVVCVVCHAAVETEYFQINRSIVCPRCRAGVEAAAEAPRGLMPLAVACVFGLGAGIAGALIYYAVLVIAHLQIGIVAILIGYMVGYAVRKGARGRGGLRFQILAVLLTYVSVGLAYTPIALKQASAADRGARAVVGSESEPVETGRNLAAARSARSPLLFRVPLAAVLVVGLAVTLPVIVIFGSLPSGLISALIIFIGMRQAWRMTGAPWLQILGPYRVGAGPAGPGLPGAPQVATPA